jgi:ribosomal subunit interface protein
MQIDIHKHDVTLTPQMDKLIEDKAAKLEKRLKTLHPDVARLEIQLHFQDRQSGHVECAITLHAFRTLLHAKKVAPELREAVDDAFDALLREVEHYRVKVNKSLGPHEGKAVES